MTKCECYHTKEKTTYTYNFRTGAPIPHDTGVGVCWGTRECDECNCGGDTSKCDFYEHVRNKTGKPEQKKPTTPSKFILELPAPVGTPIYIPHCDYRGMFYVVPAEITGYEYDGTYLIATTNLNYFLQTTELYFTEEEAQRVCDKHNYR